MGLSSHLTLDTRRLGDAAVVSVGGDIDLTAADAVESALDAARGQCTVLVLDLRAVGFMDTSGLRLVISCQQRAEADGYRFAVVPGSDKIRRLFEIAGFPQGHPLFAGAPTELAGGDGA
ncbi:MAG TPA: STAS domain-containing protein [Solirubrobacteraceae bacterium]|nr:STAS domain-containing protein [Solirubrobacteraceae bacterium]